MILVEQTTGAEESQADLLFGRWSAPKLIAGGAYVPVMQTTGGMTILAYNQARQGTSGKTNPAYRVLLAESLNWTPAEYVHLDEDEEEGFRQVTIRYDSVHQAQAIWRSDSAVFYAAQDQWANNQFSIAFEDSSKTIENIDLAVGSDNAVHIVVATGTNPYNVYHAFFDGETWVVTELAAELSRRLVAVKAAVDHNNNVHVVWEERSSLVPETYQIYYAQGARLADGYSWSAAEAISAGINRARRPAILAMGNELHVTFTRYVADDEQTIYYSRRPADGSNWTAPVDITGNSPLAVNLAPRVMASSLAWCQDSLHVFYFGGLQANSNEQIFGQQYQYDGWQSREMITDNSVRRIRPTAVCHNNRLQLAYEQIITPGINHAIYVVAAYEQVHLPLIVKN